MITASFYDTLTGAFVGKGLFATAANTLADAPVILNTPAGTTPIVGAYDAALYRFDIPTSSVVSRDPTPVTVQLYNLSAVLNGVPLGALVTVGGDTSLTVTNTNPAGIVTLNFSVAGNYTITVACFPSQDFNLSFKLPPTVTPATGTLTATGNAPTLLPQRITVPTGALAFVGGPSFAPSALVPKVASLTLTGIAASVQRNVPDSVDLTLTGYAPTAVVAVQNRTITPNTAALRMQLGFVFPMTGALALTGNAPVLNVSGGSAGNLSPGTGTLTLLAVDNALVDTVGRTGAAALSLTGYAPLVVSALVPKAGAITMTVNPVAVPFTGELNLTGN